MWEGVLKLDICDFRDFAKTTFSTERSSSKSIVEGICHHFMRPGVFLKIRGVMLVKRKKSRGGARDKCENAESTKVVFSYFYRRKSTDVQ